MHYLGRRWKYDTYELGHSISCKIAFAPNEDSVQSDQFFAGLVWLATDRITKARLFKYVENFTSKKIEIFQKKTSLIFFILLLKT